MQWSIGYGASGALVTMQWNIGYRASGAFATMQREPSLPCSGSLGYHAVEGLVTVQALVTV